MRRQLLLWGCVLLSIGCGSVRPVTTVTPAMIDAQSEILVRTVEGREARLSEPRMVNDTVFGHLGVSSELYSVSFDSIAEIETGEFTTVSPALIEGKDEVLVKKLNGEHIRLLRPYVSNTSVYGHVDTVSIPLGSITEIRARGLRYTTTGTIGHGDYIRLSSEQYPLLPGRVTELTDEIIVMSDTAAILLSSVTSIELRHRHANAGRGAVYGLGGGLVLGLGVSALISGTSSTADLSDLGTGVAVVGAPVVGALGGLLIGAVIGAFVKTDTWEAVRLGQLRASFVPQREGRFALGLSVRF